MKGYSLFKKGKDRPIRISVFSDDGVCVDVLVFPYKKGITDSADVEDDEEIREVEVVGKGGS